MVAVAAVAAAHAVARGIDMFGYGRRQGSVGDSKCSVVVAVEIAVVSVSMLALLGSLAKVWREL